MLARPRSWRRRTEHAANAVAAEIDIVAKELFRIMRDVLLPELLVVRAQALLAEAEDLTGFELTQRAT